jgi:tetratricopeptide (TPR) repeat protein
LRVFPVLAVFLLGMAAAEARDLPQAPVYGDYLAARFAADHFDLAAAADKFRDSLKRDPGNIHLLSSAFFFSVVAGRVEEAAGYAGRLAGAVEDKRAAHLVMSMAAFKHHDFKRAHDEIAAAGADEGSAYTIPLLDAWAAAGQGNRADTWDAIAMLHGEEGIALLADFNEALAAEFLGDNARAETAYRKVLKAAGPSPRFVDAFGRFLERTGKAPEASALYDAAKVNAAYRPTVEPALKRISEGIKPEALIPRAEDGAAEAMFGVAASLNDASTAMDSIFYLQLALYLRPDLDLAKLLLANRFESVERFDLAAGVYTGIAEDSPYRRLASLNGASDKMRLKDYGAALKDMQALANREDGNIEFWMSYGDLLRQLKKNSEAAAAYGKAVALAGTPAKQDWTLYYARATAEEGAGNWNAAEADLQTAQALNPDEPEVLNFLGYSWVDRGTHLKEATAMLEKAVKLASDNGYIIDSVGWAYYRLGRYADAVKMLERALQLVPEDVAINDHLGDAYWKAGRKLEAGFQWNHALAYGAEGDDKARIEKKLASGPDK